MFKISPKQATIATTFVRNETYLIADGGIRSGKTKFLVYSFVDWMKILTFEPTISKQDLTFFVLHYSYTNAIDVVMLYIEEKLRMEGIRLTQSKKTFSFEYNKKTIFIHAFGVNNKSSFKSFQGQTYRGGFVDEAAILEDNAIDVAVGRTFTYEDAKIFMTSNPEGDKTHWYYRKFLAKENKNIFWLNFSTYDNPIVSKGKIDEMIKLMNIDDVQRRIYGKWVGRLGKVYKRFPKVVKDLPEEFEYILVGNDYGESDATVSTVVGFVDGKYYVISELYIKDTTDTIITKEEKQRQQLNWIAKKYNCPIDDYNETSPSSIYNLKKNDVKINSRINILKVNKKKEIHRSKSAIQERIDATNILIAFDNLFVHESCENLIEAFETAVYKDGTRLDDGTTKVDCLDAFEYAIKVDIKYIINQIEI